MSDTAAHRARQARHTHHADADRMAEPDIGAPVPRRHPVPHGVSWAVLGAISAGGALGAVARYGLTAAFPYTAGVFPWATFGINVAGCLLIGVLMVVITESGRVHPLVRPFAGVGVLGGFTTFSTYVVDVQRAVSASAAATGLAYLVATPVAALVAVYAGSRFTRPLLRPLLRRRRQDRS